MKPDGTLLLTGGEVAALLTIEECMAAVEHAFKIHGEGRTSAPGILGVHAPDGRLHIKAGGMTAVAVFEKAVSDGVGTLPDFAH